VKPIAKQPNIKAAFTPLERKPHLLGVVKKRGEGLKSCESFLMGFTIVELLTVMSIIIILMGLLAPAMNRVRRYARKVNQKNQFHSIDVALELFRAEFDGYPDSGALDRSTPAGGVPYCGAMKLAEAMVGQDLLGFHPASRFRADGTDGFNQLYYCTPPPPPPPDNIKARKEHYLPLENANVYKLKDLYSTLGPFAPVQDRVVLCDVYTRGTNLTTGKRVGMPILYYRANTSRTVHDLVNPDNAQNIYDYKDNNMLVERGKPWDPATPHTLFSTPAKFYESTWNEKVSAITRPYRADSFILISAGFDGEYGTPDDVFNFEED
jgi:type II secretory pathway pseudopilin PulG